MTKQKALSLGPIEQYVGSFFERVELDELADEFPCRN